MGWQRFFPNDNNAGKGEIIMTKVHAMFSRGATFFPKCFTYINSGNAQNNPLNSILLLLEPL